jgi:hypothetical protein
MKFKIMKKHLILSLGGFLLSFNLVLAQPLSPPPLAKDSSEYAWVKVTNSLPRFDLDFPGGTPKNLVEAIKKATGKPLNTVIPNDCADLRIPEVSVKNVTVAQLFAALTQASKTIRRYDVVDPLNPAHGDLNEHATTYGFRTEGAPDENSIWFFTRDGDPGVFQMVSPVFSRFYQLSPYLEAGYKVEDITTALETAWSMLGVVHPPEIKYHKDTKVLIAVGTVDNLKVIDDVLKQLSTERPKEKPSANQN